jgi:hypothetical protein
LADEAIRPVTFVRQMSAAVRLQAAIHAPPGASAVATAARPAVDSAAHLVAVPSSCTSPRKGGHHGSATASSSAAAGCGTWLPSAAAGRHTDAGSVLEVTQT